MVQELVHHFIILFVTAPTDRFSHTRSHGTRVKILAPTDRTGTGTGVLFNRGAVVVVGDSSADVVNPRYG